MPPAAPLTPATSAVVGDRGAPPQQDSKTVAGGALPPSGAKALLAPPVAFLTLEPGLTRGQEKVPEIQLSPRTTFIAATLRFLDEPPPELICKVTNSAGETVWTGGARLSENDVKELRTVVNIPVKGLRVDDYRLAATHRTASGEKQVAVYYWKIRP